MDLKDGAVCNERPGAGLDGPENIGESAVTAAVNFLSSVRLAVFIIAALAVVCAVGTVIPQLKDPHFYRQAYGVAAEIILWLSLDDAYHSFIFYFVVALLCLNISVCTLRRLTLRLAALRSPGNRPGAPGALRVLKFFREIDGFPEIRLNETILRLKKSGWSVVVDETAGEGGVSGFAERGRFSFAGEQLTHLSVLIVIAGAIIGNVYGYKAYFRAYPGDRISVPAPRYQAVRARLERLMAKSRAAGADPHAQAAPLMRELAMMDASGEKELFGLRVKDFKTEYFEKERIAGGGSDGPSGAPERPVKNWNTFFSVEEGGREILSGVISVNSPLAHRGVNIYQSSYYSSRDALKRLKIKAVDRAAVTSLSQTVEFGAVGSEAHIFGGKYRLKLLSFIYDFDIDPQSREIFSAGDSPGNAAVKVQIISSDSDGADANTVWLFEASADFGEKMLERMKYDFSLRIESVETSRREATGLQVNYDPGAGLVWLGFFLMSCGLFISFNFCHKRIWFHYERPAAKLLVGGVSNKNDADFVLELDSIFGPAVKKNNTEAKDGSKR